MAWSEPETSFVHGKAELLGFEGGEKYHVKVRGFVKMIKSLSLRLVGKVK